MTTELPQQLQEEPQQIAGKLPRAPSGLRKLWARLRAFYIESKRVMKVTKKPSRFEFSTIVKITGIGMAVIGVVGFLIHMIKELLF
ncbi:protein translocase SEC61 complex subunit gamma [Candidatus Woesearchaeota archaeon]|nr:protein translocase SEC61 complex subunit gamma [Candidatus Woesearchaeota archaeon]